MTTAQAWRQIAEAFEQYEATGNASDCGGSGLCLALTLWAPDLPTCNAMRAQFHAARPDGLGWWWFPERANAGERAFLAYLLAEAAEEPV